MINHLKPINSNFTLGVKMCKKYPQNAIVTSDVGKISTTVRKSET